MIRNVSSEQARSERWLREKEYFDRVAGDAAEALSPLSRRTLHRYAALRRRRFSLEYRFRVLGDLKGKRVLDIGCGDGTNTVLFARLGAIVTGVDISPESIELARKRARINGVEQSATFICAPIELAVLEPQSFDVVFGDAILHHVIPELDAILARCREWVRRGGVIVLAEPVALIRAVRKFRLWLPVTVEGTPDERPLETREIERVLASLEPCSTRMFALFSRLERFLIANHDAEHSRFWREAVFQVLVAIDYVLLSIPGIRRLGGSLVIVSRP